MNRNYRKFPLSWTIVNSLIAILVSGISIVIATRNIHAGDTQLVILILSLSAVIIVAAITFGLTVRNQRILFYREKYENEVARHSLIKHLDFIVRFANDIILLTDNDLRILEANDAAISAYGYTRDELIGSELRKILGHEALVKMKERLKILNDKGSYTFETLHLRKDGTEFPLEISARVIDIEGEKFIQTIARDITERINAQNTLKESEEKFRKIFEESPLCMLMTDKDLRIIKMNHAFCRLFGYSQEELSTFTFRNFTHPDYIGKDEEAIRKLVARQIPVYHTRKPYIKKDGGILWGSTTINTIRNQKDELLFFLAMIEDITSRKAAEAELERSLSLLEATIESTADGLLVVDLEWKIILYNRKFAEMWKIPKEIFDTGDDTKLLQYVKEQLVDPETFLFEVEQLYKSNDTTRTDVLEFRDGRFFERYSQPQIINSKSVGRVWSFRDITEKKRVLKELITAKEKAEEGDRLKTAFLHNVSHEIRTPMNAIIGFSTLMNETGLTDQERLQYAGIISQSSGQLLSIINDIVDIANIESGQVKINMSEWHLNRSLRSLVDQFSYNRNSISLNLFIELPDEESLIITDGTKVIQIISNLINNALKFTKEGRIDFGYLVRDNFLEFFVTDTGIGISGDHMAKIFNRFYQVDGAGTREYGGTGLGLSICKAYAGLLGGTIWVKSEPGKGSEFRFTIPYKRMQ